MGEIRLNPPKPGGAMVFCSKCNGPRKTDMTIALRGEGGNQRKVRCGKCKHEFWTGESR